jgi:hypothetical protein
MTIEIFINIIFGSVITYELYQIKNLLNNINERNLMIKEQTKYVFEDNDTLFIKDLNEKSNKKYSSENKSQLILTTHSNISNDSDNNSKNDSKNDSDNNSKNDSDNNSKNDSKNNSDNNSKNDSDNNSKNDSDNNSKNDSKNDSKGRSMKKIFKSNNWKNNFSLIDLLK